MLLAAATMAFVFAAATGVSVRARAPASVSVVAARPGAFAVAPRYGYVVLWGEEIDGGGRVAMVYVMLSQWPVFPDTSGREGGRDLRYSLSCFCCVLLF